MRYFVSDGLVAANLYPNKKKHGPASYFENPAPSFVHICRTRDDKDDRSDRESNNSQDEMIKLVQTE